MRITCWWRGFGGGSQYAAAMATDQQRSSRAHYERNSGLIKARARRWTLRQRDILRGITRAAKDVPCADCGESYPPWVMEFDHVHGEKDADVAEAPNRGWSVERLRREIAKCEVVCSNCHAERTHNRRVAAGELSDDELPSKRRRRLRYSFDTRGGAVW